MEHFQNNFYYFNYVKDNTNIEISDNVQKLNDNTLNYKHNYVYGVVQCMHMDTTKSRLLNFGGIKQSMMYRGYMFNSQKTIVAHDYCNVSNIETIGELIKGRGYMSLCNINNKRIAIIGGEIHTNQWNSGVSMND
eukprot:195240_1